MKTSRFVLWFAVSLMLLSCKGGTDYVQFLYVSMPLPDSLVHPREYWENNVAKTLEVREKMHWNVPEREFRHFVLPLRVNNENLDDFRTVYADSLCARVAGMSMAEAALEINHWCHERVTYAPSDGRTLGPEAAIRSGLARCGEESVLAVSALRAAGIPARQVYTPRWAHTDDNHAWVEVYVDGGWHFMGACEPEPVLDLGWFNASVSRAMLLHTMAFGDYDGPEDVISRTRAYTEINVTSNYVPTRLTSVTVKDTDGNPVAGARVEFKIYNYAEFYTVATCTSDDSGRASLLTGIGDVAVWASKGDRFGLCIASEDENSVVLDRTFGERFSMDVNVVPPAENPLPNRATAAQIEENAARLASEDAIRNSLPHPRTQAPELFISRKDAVDISPEVLEDASEGGLTGDRFVDAPRIELEMLLPYRREIRNSGIGERLLSPSDVARWVKDSIAVDVCRNPQKLRIPPVAVWRGRIADAFSRDIFFVALCRSLGFAARIDEVTGAPQYSEDGRWVTVDFDEGTGRVAECGTLKTSGKARYYTHYTVSRIEDGTCRLCEFDEELESPSENELETGYYMMTGGTRLADGSVLVHIEFFDIPSGGKVELPVVLRNDPSKLSVIGSVDAECKFLPDGSNEASSILSATGRGYFLLCIMGESDEPTIHAVGQMTAMASRLNAWGRKVVILGKARPEGVENAVSGKDEEGRVAAMVRSGMDSPSAKLPLIVVADTFGRVVYFSQGYNTSLESGLSNTLDKL